MGRILQFDSIGGASGDMVLGALIDLGVDADTLRNQLRGLVGPDFELGVQPVVRGGLRGMRVSVVIPHGAHHEHRGLSDIVRLTSASALPDAVKEDVKRVFTRLGEAEAHVHGVSVEQVHFHEVGAMDSIIDIAGSCLCRHLLGVDGVAVGPLPLGHGTIASSHGVLPLPAPATVELLKGFETILVDEPAETVTPTGASLLTSWKTLSPPVAGTILAVGHGFGSRELRTRPNLLRAILLDRQTPAGADSCLVLECNLDDTSPELLGSLMQQLMAAGALDAFTTAVQMKKQRPGVLLTVLCEPASKAELLDLIFRESTTFGVREHEAARTILQRRHVEVATPYGTVRVKVGTWQGRDITHSPEHDDCARLAREKGVAVREVYEAAVRALRS